MGFNMCAIIAWALYRAAAEVWDSADIGNMPDERDLLAESMATLGSFTEGDGL